MLLPRDFAASHLRHQCLEQCAEHKRRQSQDSLGKPQHAAGHPGSILVEAVATHGGPLSVVQQLQAPAVAGRAVHQADRQGADIPCTGKPCLVMSMQSLCCHSKVLLSFLNIDTMKYNYSGVGTMIGMQMRFSEGCVAFVCEG